MGPLVGLAKDVVQAEFDRVALGVDGVVVRPRMGLDRPCPRRGVQPRVSLAFGDAQHVADRPLLGVAEPMGVSWKDVSCGDDMPSRTRLFHTLTSTHRSPPPLPMPSSARSTVQPAL